MMYLPQGPPQFVSPQVPPQFSTPQGPHTSINMPTTNYKLLDEQIKAIEGFSTNGMDAKESCLVPNFVLPLKLKVPDLQKHKGVEMPE